VRDLGRFALRAQTILLAAHCRVLRELDDSKIGRLQFLCSRGTSLAFDLASAHHGSYVRRHPVRSRASQSDSRNRVCKDQSGVADGIYSPRSCGSADVAKEFAQVRLPSFATRERDSRRLTLLAKSTSEKADENPLTSILSPEAGRGETYAENSAPRGRARTPKAIAKQSSCGR